MPGQIPVGCCSRGVVTHSFDNSGSKGKAAIPSHLHYHADHAAIAATCRWGCDVIQCHRLLWGRQTLLWPSS